MPFHVSQNSTSLETRGRGIYDLLPNVREIVESSGVMSGTAHIFCLHTSASLILCENADPDVMKDMETFMSELVKDGDPSFVHRAEGPDDMPAHVRTILTGSDMTIPVGDGRLTLGTWQGIYLWEHRSAPHVRRIVVTVTGE